MLRRGTAGALALFVERARAADPRFALGPDNVDAVAEVCRRLDGLPLAIELAAARVRHLGAHGLRDMLDDRFRVLTGGRRAVMPRHRTLLATLEWSHSLLADDERTAAACAVGLRRRLHAGAGAGADGRRRACDEWAVLDALGHLVDKSLVVAEGGDRPRYRLLETTRAFAIERLAESGRTAAIARTARPGHAGGLRRRRRGAFRRRRHPRRGELHAAPAARTGQPARRDGLGAGAGRRHRAGGAAGRRLGGDAATGGRVAARAGLDARARQPPAGRTRRRLAGALLAAAGESRHQRPPADGRGRGGGAAGGGRLPPHRSEPSPALRAVRPGLGAQRGRPRRRGDGGGGRD